MGKMVAIGGGELKDLETLPIDQRIVELTGKRGPRALFIPTASSDAPDYAETFRRVYAEYQVITSKAGARAYRVYRGRGEIVSEPIEPIATFQPLAGLLEN